jgi:hypothetical protein
MEEKLKQKILALCKAKKVRVGEPLTPKDIERIESKLGFEIPQEYKDFLATFGSLTGFGLEIMGNVPPESKGHILPCGEESLSALGTTLDLRERFLTFPRNCIAIEYDGGDGYYCLVCSGKDYGKVIFWDMWCDPKQAYPNIPTPEWFKKHPNWARGAPEKNIPPHLTGKKEDFWVEGFDFWHYVILRLQKCRGR